MMHCHHCHTRSITSSIISSITSSITSSIISSITSSITTLYTSLFTLYCLSSTSDNYHMMHCCHHRGQCCSEVFSVIQSILIQCSSAVSKVCCQRSIGMTISRWWHNTVVTQQSATSCARSPSPLTLAVEAPTMLCAMCIHCVACIHFASTV